MIIMSYVLVIAEKPTAAKKIAESLAEGKLKVFKKNDVNITTLKEMVNHILLHQQ
jgi:DNA topoisomerase IA